MASSSQHSAGLTTAPPPPPPEEVSAFFTLVVKVAAAAALSRHARCAELCHEAAKHSERLWGNNSLVVADLRVGEAIALREIARASTSLSEQEALMRNAWAILGPIHALLLRRLADNTLLPGTIKEEEVMYHARLQAFLRKAHNAFVLPKAVLRGQGVVLGYDLVKAASITLAFLSVLQGAAPSRESAQSIVLTALDAIPRTATAQFIAANEGALVTTIETHMKPQPQNFEPSFYAAVLRKWGSSAVVNVLRARGVLQIGVAAHQGSLAEHEVRQRADIEKIGLRECALPACDKVERTVREFKQCSGCRSVWYCSPEHHTLHWGAHKNVCRALDAERRDAIARDEASLEAQARALALD